ncbi:HYD1 signature containing ADP-ribosyltransferase family protein [Myroides sp. DF42-4-2]|uniref:HYD1 signature containing ADP-ribosyltransferase family protein n=1 Tax=Myroides sp. DF42-4-2 TaxID=2746726 RepID=UPI002576536B|nr:HYD1 signature containing ADP-ribosyltransferase family protein [Myroides sp. DF42-4-2]MDM1408407.1 hypothetical protein [Myroides sp. DF42-4-2]
MEIITVYHYKSKDGYIGILGNGVIEARDPGKKGKGAIKNKQKGVYVTRISPDQLQASGKKGQIGLSGDKSTHYIAFQIDSKDVKLVDPQNSALRLYIENDIRLRDSNTKLMEGVTHGATPYK